ncbi:MAG TPA: DUF6600 domain-containing protein [Steroidobacteraceae bacterium]|nr:DUF6600 domain-containing protein [Steroidobacteraceae bacterium]
MRTLSVLGGLAAGMLILAGSFGAAFAQEQPPGDQTQMIEQLGEDADQGSNPPGRVAQMSAAEGSVSLEPAGTDGWTSAVLNRPLTLGDKLWTDENSRAELDIGDAVVRLGSTTGFSFLNLDDQTAQMQVSAGTVIVHVRELSSGEQDEIDTPNLALTLQQPGTYRIEVSDSGDTTIVKVESGEALATGGGQSFRVTAQQSVTFTGTSTLAADYASLGSPDSFDDWSMQREQQMQQQAAVAQEYVPPDMVGADDLGSYGTWENTPDWGYAWFPTVAVGWTPYSNGNWVWISPWGWTWVDAAPWGFAPFHYGRWGYWHRRWCWVPGPRRIRPVYAPALVGWVGGRHGRVSVTTGAHVGWFPLGPRDVYVPGYHASRAYVRNVNMANTRLVNAGEIGNAYRGHVGNVRYANIQVPGAVTAVPRNVFTSAQLVGPHRVILPHQGGFRATALAPAIMPGRQSVLGARAGRVVRVPPRAVVNRPIVARLAPPRAPVSFAREQAAMRANGGRPVSMAELSRMRPYTPAVRVRLTSPSAPHRPGLELHTAPDRRGAAAGANMSAREHVLQNPSLPPARTPRNDRPPWVQRQMPAAPVAPGQQRFAPAPRQDPEQHFAPRTRQRPDMRLNAPQRQAPGQHFTPPARQVPEQHFNAPQRQMPPQRFAPPVRQVPQQHNAPQRQMPPQRFAPPVRQVPEQHFNAPQRQMPPQRFAPPVRQVPEQHFNAPQRQMPPQRFSPPARQIPQRAAPRFSPPAQAHPSAPRAAPAARGPERRPP